ncbi:MAG TPA: hypothetical protein VGB55_05210 [Tepidisphaeraceae bacterium]
MEKVIELLEKHCQWIAIGLGGLFLTWVLWSYALMNPVMVTAADGRQLGPADVDEWARSTHGQALDQQINDPAPVRPPGDPAKINEVQTPVMAVIAGEDRKVPPLSAFKFTSPGSDLEIKERQGVEDTKVLVEAVPTIPPALVEDSSKSARMHTTMQVSDAANPGVPAAPPPAPGAPGAVPPDGRDITYAFIQYRIATKEIAAAFNAVKIPNSINKTSVIGVKLMRQEMQPTGEWGPATEVPLPANNIVPPTIPPAGSPLQVINAFRSRIESPQGVSDLLRPPFFQLILGEGPWDPPMELPTVDLAKEREEQMREARRLNEEKQKQNNATRRGNTPQMPPEGRGGPGGRGGRGPLDGGMPPGAPMPFKGLPDTHRDRSPVVDSGQLDFQQVRRPAPGRPPMPNPLDEADAQMRGQPGQPPQPWQPPEPGQPPQPGQPQGPPPAASEFNPATEPDVVGWAYDTTVQEGRTYRYQVLYCLRNPVYDANENVVSKPEIARAFALWSTIDEKAWSKEIIVPTSTYYFLAGPGWLENSIPGAIKIDVYKWAVGKWQHNQFAVSPGDRIGRAEEKVNYGTDAVLVDVRFDGRRAPLNAFALILSPDGRLIERDPKTDREANLRVALQRAVEQASNPTGAPGTVGMPPDMPPNMPPGFGPDMPGMPPGARPGTGPRSPR